MRENYQRGGYGYGHAKKELLELLKTKFADERARFDEYMQNKPEVDRLLAIGAEKARSVAEVTLKRVRDRLGY